VEKQFAIQRNEVLEDAAVTSGERQETAAKTQEADLLLRRKRCVRKYYFSAD
jgi:hypothetical protein